MSAQGLAGKGEALPVGQSKFEVLVMFLKEPARELSDCGWNIAGEWRRAAGDKILKTEEVLDR